MLHKLCIIFYQNKVVELFFTAIDFRFTEGVEGKLSGSSTRTVLNSTKYCPLIPYDEWENSVRSPRNFFTNLKEEVLRNGSEQKGPFLKLCVYDTIFTASCFLLLPRNRETTGGEKADGWGMRS